MHPFGKSDGIISILFKCFIGQTLKVIRFDIFFQREAGKKVVEKYQAFAEEQKAKIEDLGAATQQKRGKRKKRN